MTNNNCSHNENIASKTHTNFAKNSTTHTQAYMCTCCDKWQQKLRHANNFHAIKQINKFVYAAAKKAKKQNKQQKSSAEISVKQRRRQ